MRNGEKDLDDNAFLFLLIFNHMLQIAGARV